MGERWEEEEGELSAEGAFLSCWMTVGIPVLDGYIRGGKISPSAISLKHPSVKLCSIWQTVPVDVATSLPPPPFPTTISGSSTAAQYPGHEDFCLEETAASVQCCHIYLQQLIRSTSNLSYMLSMPASQGWRPHGVMKVNACPRCCYRNDGCIFEMEASPWFPKGWTSDIFTEVSSSSPFLWVFHGVRLW